MKVCIATGSLAGHTTGIERYLGENLARLDGLAPEYGLDIECVYPRDSVPDLSSLRNARGVAIEASGARYLPALRHYLRRERALYVNMSGGMALERGIVVFHDARPAVFSQFDSRKARLRYQTALAYARKQARRIVTVSEFSKYELVTKLDIDPDRIDVIGNAWQHMRDIVADDGIFARYPRIVPGSYFYTLGSRAPHKNMRWVAEVARRHPEDLFVVAGKVWDDADDGTPTAPNLLYVGYVSDAESKALMSACRAFLHPSLYEGFGIPPLEAASCGAPLIVSSTSSLPEVFGKDAAYVSPYSYDVDLEELLAETYGTDVAIGFKRPNYERLLARYSWDDSARQWAELLVRCGEGEEESRRLGLGVGLRSDDARDAKSPHFIREGQVDDRARFNAGSKARDDVNEILDTCGLIPEDVHVRLGARSDPASKVAKNLFSYGAWRAALDKAAGELAVVQYPPTGPSRMLTQDLRRAVKRGTRIALLIHDLETFRHARHVGGGEGRRVSASEFEHISMASYVVAHNDAMREEVLRAFGVPEERVVSLEMFDYLTPFDPSTRTASPRLPLVVAGNLAREKCGFLYDLPEGLHINLYGMGLEDDPGDACTYLGAVEPGDLPQVIEGSFGLVWSSSTSDTCDGVEGEYLRLNNPHKTSLCLAAGLPVIVWDQAAVASFVRREQVGLVVSSLHEVPALIDAMDQEAYDELCANVSRVSERLRSGFYTKCAIKRVLELDES
ncbi:MAG: glycosyltransferase [Atopobiaceae bacterium]|nr:glycosyltransferase [Atopobiaceae bacterium]